MSEYEIDPIVWFTDRKLSHTPPHFIVVKTPITEESKLWILSNLRGRFSIVTDVGLLLPLSDKFKTFLLSDLNENFPAFEDPKEAMMYELKWS